VGYTGQLREVTRVIKPESLYNINITNQGGHMELWLIIVTFISVIAVVKAEINTHQLRATIAVLEQNNIEVPHFSDVEYEE